MQGTFSVWQDVATLREFAFGGNAHRAVIDQTANRRWYAEQLFARFGVLSASGSLDGLDPLDVLNFDDGGARRTPASGSRRGPARSSPSAINDAMAIYVVAMNYPTYAGAQRSVTARGHTANAVSPAAPPCAPTGSSSASPTDTRHRGRAVVA